MKKTSFFLILFLAWKSSFSQTEKNTLREIDILIGTWTVHAEKRLSAQGPWDTSAGKAVISKVVGATVIEENFYGSLEGKPFITKTLIATDKFIQKYQRVFADSEHGVFVDYEGEKNGDSIIFEKNWIYPNKSTVKLRVVYKIISKDEFIIENMRMPEHTSVWDITGKMRYKRLE